MTVVPQSSFPTSVLVVAPEPSVRNAIARLLSLESGIAVVGTAASMAQAIQTGADVIVDEGVLASLKHLSIADFIDMIRTLPVMPGSAPDRHLRPVETRRDMRSVLSQRELEVVRLVAEGLSNKQISLQLKLSDKTVKNHISHILAKMGLSARTQVAVHALRAGLV